MDLQMLCSTPLGIIYVFQNAIMFTLNISYGAGKLIVSTLIFIATQFYSLISCILIGIKVMLEDFCVFAFDVFNKLSFFILNIQYLLDCIISSGFYLILFIKNCVLGAFHHFVLSINSVLNLVTQTYNGIIMGFELFKQALILIGNSIWYTIQLVPFCIIYLFSLVVFFIAKSFEELHTLILTITRGIFQAVCNIFNFVTDIPLESYLGLTFAALLTIFSIKYQRLIQSTISHCLQSSYVSFLRLISKIAVGLQKIKIFMSGNYQNSVDELTIFSLIENFHEKYFSLTLFAKQYYENEEPLSNEELLNRLAREQEQRLCVVCQDKGKNIILMPCRHLCLCQTCCSVIQKREKKCPICRQTIRRIINVYS